MICSACSRKVVVLAMVVEEVGWKARIDESFPLLAIASIGLP